MIIELKHGELQGKLQVCNESLELAIPKFEADTETEISSLFNGVGSFAVFARYYAYFSYKIYCQRNPAQTQKYTIGSFMEMITKDGVLAEESNIAEVYEKMGQTIVDRVEKKMKQIKENPQQLTATNDPIETN
ncbi:hypothetical protein [Emticicia sp. C21]|uniref:hypothetical protein n=1 Tax=Emticicia sp. C21 TaxID=2302915 RepID=UPI000E356EB5|nr:hypothetical protein [Emticicia sp. C21]RFS17002.1 hypothetical protein D0T08_10010 [Emticicia sp. C21]